MNNRTDQTLLEQMRITDLEIKNRKALFNITFEDKEMLSFAKPLIEREIDHLVKQFYDLQTSVPEIALLIGDADTLERLRGAQHQYIIDLFSGIYDIEYVNNRLRIGMIHKRIGVEPKLYLSAVHQLKTLLMQLIATRFKDQPEKSIQTQSALEKLFMFDVSLVFDTYIRSLISEIESSKLKSEEYAIELEKKVKERTMQLEMVSRTDALTGLLNVRHLYQILTKTLRASQRRLEPVSVAYLDINNFKLINDNEGHHRGDEILRIVANAINRVSRDNDQCFRHGGDEFCIVLPSCTEKQACEIYGQRLIKEIQKQEPDLTISVGFMQAGPYEYPSAEEVIRIADKNMYEEKNLFKSSQPILSISNDDH